MITLNLARGDNYESVPLRLPTTPGEVDEVFAALDAASRYAGEVQIIGVDSGVPSLAKHLKGAGLTDPDAFDKLNRLAEKIDGMDERQRDIFSGALDAESAGSLDDVLRVSDSLEAYTFVPNVRSATGGLPKERGRIWTLPKSARSILPATAAPILSAAM